MSQQNLDKYARGCRGEDFDSNDVTNYYAEYNGLVHEPTSVRPIPESTPTVLCHSGSEQLPSFSGHGFAVLESESIPIPNRIFVGGLHRLTSKQELIEIFEIYGNIMHANVIKDQNDRCKGYGFVTYTTAEEALRVCNNFFGPVIHRGQYLNIGPALMKQVKSGYQHGFTVSSPTYAMMSASQPYGGTLVNSLSQAGQIGQNQFHFPPCASTEEFDTNQAAQFYAYFNE